MLFRSDGADGAVVYRRGNVVAPALADEEPLVCELADFCRAICDGTPPRSSLEIGVDVLRVLEAVDRSLELGGERVEVAALPVSVHEGAEQVG